MKKLFLLSLAAAASLSCAAAGQWTIKGNTYTVDTLFHAEIGPGTTQTSLSLSGNLNLQVFYTTIDLTNPYVDVRALKAGNKFSSCMTPEAQAKSADRQGARYFAGINGDFFANNAPCGSTVVDGEVYNTVNNAWSAWYMTDDKIAHTADLGYRGTCYFPDGSTHVVSGINGTRGEDGLNIYTLKHNGSNTGTNKYGREVTIVPIEGDLAFSGKSKYKVTCEPVAAGSMAIPANGYVLSGHVASNSTANYAGALIAKLHIGDEITLDLYPTLAGSKITQLVSGLPIILQNGKPLDNESRDPNLLSNRHPRSSVGHTADGKKVVLMIVDGRSSISSGVTSTELADIMREAGCDEAMNLDGGGSSALYTTALGYRNHPSDGSPRACTNSLWAVYTAPDDDNIARLSFTDKIVNLPKYGQYTPQLYAYNQYGLLLNDNFKDFTLSCAPELGSISDDGKTLFVTGSGKHELTAKHGNISVTVPVIVGSGEPSFRLASVIVDGYKTYTTEVTSKVGDLEMPLDNKALNWASDNESVATVDENGIISGVANGTATVTGKVENTSRSIAVEVQKPETRFIAVDPQGATITKSSIKDESITIGADGKSFNLAFTISSPRGPKATVNLKKVLYSLPDSIAIDFNPGDITVSKVDFSVTANGGRAVIKSVSGPFTPNAVNRAMLPVSDFADATDFAIYPLTLNNVAFNVSGTSGTVANIAVSDVHTVHTAISADQGGVDDIIADTDSDSESEAVYYDLQGRRVNPENRQLLIRKSGHSATKVVK